VSEWRAWASSLFLANRDAVQCGLLAVVHTVRLEGSFVASWTNDVKIRRYRYSWVRTVNINVFVKIPVQRTVAEFLLRTNRRAWKKFAWEFQKIYLLCNQTGHVRRMQHWGALVQPFFCSGKAISITYSHCSCYCSLFLSLCSLFLLLFICYPNWGFSVLFPQL
jgi:hypothetical protein